LDVGICGRLLNLEISKYAKIPTNNVKPTFNMFGMNFFMIFNDNFKAMYVAK